MCSLGFQPGSFGLSLNTLECLWEPGIVLKTEMTRMPPRSLWDSGNETVEKQWQQNGNSAARGAPRVSWENLRKAHRRVTCDINVTCLGKLSSGGSSFLTKGTHQCVKI